jgi:hypothetical protein
LSFVELLPNGYLVLKKIYTFGLDVFLSSDFAEILAESIKKREDNKFCRDTAEVFRREKLDPKVFRRDKATKFCVILIEKSYL